MEAQGIISMSLEIVWYCWKLVFMAVLIFRLDGYLFDKEAILEYIITKKNEYCRKLKEYEKQKRKEEVYEIIIIICFVEIIFNSFPKIKLL